MKHLFLLQAYGDNLISLSILKQSETSEYKIYGTQLSAEIAELLNINHKINIVCDRIPAFYDIRARGIYAAFKDLFVLYRFITRNIPAGDTIIFEKSDVRFWLFRLIFRHYVLQAPKKERNVYQDRALCFGAQELTIRAFCKGDSPRDIVINPLGRSPKKYLSQACIKEVLSLCEAHGFRVHFIDYLGIYPFCRERVYSYHTNTTLKEAVSVLKAHPVYCGVDSLFIHLACYFQKSTFCIMNYDSSYFMPPMLGQSDMFIFENHDTRELKEFSSRFSQWLNSLQSEHS